jgi:hypothetical protein
MFLAVFLVSDSLLQSPATPILKPIRCSRKGFLLYRQLNNPVHSNRAAYCSAIADEARILPPNGTRFWTFSAVAQIFDRFA